MKQTERCVGFKLVPTLDQISGNWRCRTAIFRILWELWCIQSFNKPHRDIFDNSGSKWAISLPNAVATRTAFWTLTLWFLLIVHLFSIPHVCMWSQCAKYIPWMHHVDYTFLSSYSKEQIIIKNCIILLLIHFNAHDDECWWALYRSVIDFIHHKNMIMLISFLLD